MQQHKQISHTISVACGKVERPIYLYEPLTTCTHAVELTHCPA
ncbi:MAG: hypothetical protein U9O90_06860 [Euryarchaeota archaeon]|nr:hypothetical protein [Euryarchaeota archaeon]